jgi:hypothetical protein
MERTLTKRAVVTLAGEVTPARAEEVIAQLADAEEGASVSLRFSGYPYMTPGTGWRIGNALRRFSGAPLEASVPPFGEGDWFRTFTRSGLGYALAAHAGKILTDGADITAQVQNFYNAKEKRSDQNAVFIGDLHRGISVNPEREDLFRDAFLGALRYVNVRPSNFGRDGLGDVIKLSFEAIQNVFDHAKRKPLPDGTKIVSYFLLSYYKSLSGHPDPTGLLRGYVRRLARTAGRGRSDFVQVCVSDDGVGIAARQAQDASVYRGPIGAEAATVREALVARSSVKLIAQDCPIRGAAGHGYSYINASLQALRAFAVLRTGRLLAVFEGSQGSRGFEFARAELGYMPGTTLDVLVPIANESDSGPSLFPDP